jgi:methionine-gamma-lyase
MQQVKPTAKKDTDKFDPASAVQDIWVFGEFGDINPSITDSSTYTFMRPETMEELFEHEKEGCYLYSRHFNPIDKFLCDALAAMEGTEAAYVTSSGMAAITSCILQLCNAGDHIVSGWTIYGGTYAFLKNFAPRLGIQVSFVDITSIDSVRSAITDNTKVIFCESISNPLMSVPDIEALSNLAKSRGAALIVDNTFSPMILAPHKFGADIVVYSMTKFINGNSDCVAGAICSTKQMIASLMDVKTGACMLMGPVLDGMRAAGILKSLHTLHIRMKQHSQNATYLAHALHQHGLKVFYPGLSIHPQYKLMKGMMNEEFGFGGMLAIDVGSAERANRLMVMMQDAKVGYIAVSLGYFKTLFSAPAHSTSSEIPIEVQKEMGLSDGIVRISIGLDNDIKRIAKLIIECVDRLDSQ